MSVRAQLSAALRPVRDEAPLVDHAPPLTIREILVRYWPRLRPLKWALVAALVLMALAPLIEVAEILLFERLVDDVLVPATWRPLVLIVVLFISLNLISAVISGLEDYVSTWISQKFLFDLRTETFRHVLSLPAGNHQRRLGDTMSRLTSDVQAVETFMIGHLATGVDAAVRLVIFGIALLWMQTELAVASMIVIPLFWWISTRFARFVRRLSREKRRRSGSLGSVTEEHIANVALVQSFNRHDEAAQQYGEQNKAIFGAELAGSRVRALFLPLVDLTELLGTLTVVTMGVWALQTDRLTLGGLLAFLTMLAQCYQPVRDLADLVPSMYSATAGIERLTELLDTKAPSDGPNAQPLVQPRGEVRFTEATVAYPGMAVAALNGFSAEFQPGHITAVVGHSGAGKSTIANALTRHVDLASGSISVDGHVIDEVTIESLRDAVTVVTQETMLLDASVADNIAFAKPGASRAEIEAAARAADAHDFIEALPQGYATRIGQRGRTLSGGQRQRLALARALLRSSPILILDEPTTGLDQATAERVLAPLRKAAAERTVILMTHDPIAMAHADSIIEIASGSVLERA